MKKLLTTLFYCLIFVTPIYTMDLEKQNPEEMISDVSLCIVQSQLVYFHNEITTLQEARQFLVSVSLVNKQWYKHANDSTNTIAFIRNLSQKISTKGGCKEIAYILNTPGSRNYIAQSNQLFDENLTPEKIEALQKNGADLNYTYSNFNNGIFDYPLHCWVVKRNYDNVQKLLQLGTSINSCVMRCAHDQKDLLTLLLTYKPKDTGLAFAAMCHRSSEIISMLLDIEKENPQTLQSELNAALKSSIFSHMNTYLDLTKLFLNKGAQPETVLFPLISWILRYQVARDDTRQAPSLDFLQLLCSYPITDKQKLEEARDLVHNTKAMLKEISNILDTYDKG